MAARWRYFKMMDLREAEAWAAAGNVAVHHTGFPYKRWSFTCHLFCQDEATLRVVSRSLGCDLRWIQYPGNPRRVHMDIFGTPLNKALAFCKRDEQEEL